MQLLVRIGRFASDWRYAIVRRAGCQPGLQGGRAIGPDARRGRLTGKERVELLRLDDNGHCGPRASDQHKVRQRTATLTYC